MCLHCIQCHSPYAHPTLAEEWQMTDSETRKKLAELALRNLAVSVCSQLGATLSNGGNFLDGVRTVCRKQSPQSVIWTYINRPEASVV